MKVTFQLHYCTLLGENLYLTTDSPKIGQQPMNYTGGSLWTVELNLPKTVETFAYSYELHTPDTILKEKGKPRLFQKSDGITRQTLIDTWQWYAPNLPFFATAFTESIFKREALEQNNLPHQIEEGNLYIEVSVPTLRAKEVPLLLGEGETLGNWGNSFAKPLTRVCKNRWGIWLDSFHLSPRMEYKFLIESQEKHIGSSRRWEEGENRLLDFVLPQKGEIVKVTGLHFRETQPQWKAAGVAIPVFSLRSEKSCGIGDFRDLRLMLDWADQTEQKVVQILPIYDTTLSHTRMDSYPYNANSIYALHPLYLSIEELPALQDNKRAAHYEQIRQQLNALPEMDYEAVDQTKWAYFREIHTQEANHFRQDKEFKQWFLQNEDWLKPYTAFCILRDTYHTCNFAQWGEHAIFDKKKIEKLIESLDRDTSELHYFVQYHLHLQLRKVQQQAHTQNLVIKGDIPIGISPYSVEAWSEPHLFNMDSQAGAPPDFFAKGGQNWGFPTYNWEAMEQEDFRWWKRRLEKMAEYFDAYRIDHLLGFFRIWEIPKHSVEGLLGYFNPARPYSIEEIEKQKYHFVRERDTQPLVRTSTLETLFGHRIDKAMMFLKDSHKGYYSFRKEFDTQRKVEQYLQEHPEQSDNELRSLLLSLHNEVLFVEDPHHPDCFHPRIEGFETFVFQELSPTDQQAYRSLHEEFYYHRHNDFWKAQAMHKLPAVTEATGMLACAEDLGMIPSCVPAVMKQLQMLSLEVQRMPKGFEQFGQPDDYPYLSVATTSSHDTSTLREWWTECEESTQYYYEQLLWRKGKAPKECTADIVQQILLTHLKAPSMFTIFPLQDWLAISDRLKRSECKDERINIPANPHHYWRYRMHLNLEQLIADQEFNNQIRNLIKIGGRD